MRGTACCSSMGGKSEWDAEELREPEGKGGLQRVMNHQMPVVLALLLCQTVAGFYFVGTSVALDNGANSMVLSFYRDLFALVALAPIAYLWEFRRDNKVAFSPGVLSYVGILGFVGIFGSNFLLFIGIQHTTADFAAGLQPLAPVTTAFIAVLFGVERMPLLRKDGQAKLTGIISCLTGAFLMTFWHGPAIFSNSQSGSKASSHCMGKTLQESISVLPENALTANTETWGLNQWQVGVLYLCGNSMATGAFLNMQSPLLKKFPAPFTILSVAYLFGTAFMGVFCFYSVRDVSAYALGFDTNTAIILYNGVIGSALYFVMMSWTLTRVCPIYVASFNTLQPPATALVSVVFLGGTAYLSNVLGFGLIFIGLILTCWASACEEILNGAAFILPYMQTTADESIEPHIKVITDSGADSGATDSLREPLLQENYDAAADGTLRKPPVLENVGSKPDVPASLTRSGFLSRYGARGIQRR